MWVWRKAARLLLLGLLCQHTRASSAPKAWWYGEFPATEGMQGSTAKPTTKHFGTSWFLFTTVMIMQSNMGAAWSMDMASIESTRTFGKHDKSVYDNTRYPCLCYKVCLL
jgi:hypothetical protein